MNNEEYNFTVIDDNGNEVICDVISVINDEKTNEVYVLYTDYTINEKDQFNTYLSQLVEKNGKYSLKNIENREKYQYILENTRAIYGKSLKELMDSKGI